jgi:hypothetical protein
MGGVLISTIDFAKGTITFANYDAFFERYWMEAPGELITSHYADQDGKSIYLKRATSDNYCRKGEEVTFDLKGHISYFPGPYIIFLVFRKWPKIGQNGVSHFLNKLQII